MTSGTRWEYCTVPMCNKKAAPKDQLNYFRIEVSKYPNRFTTFAHITKALKPGETKRFSKNPGISGNIVRIRNVDKSKRALTLCEVKVYVKETGISYS
ncbi:hypothetical protein NP493_1312g00002 [Ridgeia piscesae]|uniref:Uncharacterized protein n=1 Tax=Ridgeia piscesae TaxID=27915 RepID=A0AAD9K8L6_RIDPI|nr:hypothetical protein NP493_1312g00002 [Ridgeia piscesae]